MQKHSTHVIDEQAVHFFKGSLPPEQWTVYDIRPDYGKDHKVELVEGGEHTGLSFWVQVKGQKRVKKLKDGTISFKLETKDLDYHTKLQAPVFLVVVDVSSRVGYWVFTQEYEQTRLRNVDWTAQGQIQIHLPASNLLSDNVALRAAVKTAIGFMARRSLGMGIGHAQDSMKRLDSRFDVRVTATSQGELIEADALEDIRVDLKFGAGFYESGRLGDLIGRGVPVSIGPGDVTADGSLLIKSVLEDTADRHGSLQLCLNGRGHLRLAHLDGEGRAIGRPHELECAFEGGVEEIRFSARTSYENLVLHGAVTSRPDKPMNLGIGYDLGCWLGRPLSSLPSFHLIEDLLGRLDEGHRMNVDLFAEGMPIFSGYMLWKWDELSSIRRTLGLVELVAQARWIAVEYKVEAVLPRQISMEEIQQVARLYRLARGEEIRIKGAVQTSSARLTKLNMQTLSKLIGLDGEPLRLALLSDRPQPFLGVEVDLGPVETQLSHMRLVEDREILVRQIREGVTPIPLTWEATAETELIVKRVSEELLSAQEAAAEAAGFLE
ncbi:DUF4365 domain-containing protein [Paludisphaera sp.]|uniref:DUF4365 domain-containing protein n=1 Tax=Paludisphaera sp. TaxID=2017432 RepID=UPI00301C6D4A